MSEIDSSETDNSTNSYGSEDNKSSGGIWSEVSNRIDDPDCDTEDVCSLIAQHYHNNYNFIFRRENQHLLMYKSDDGVYREEGEKHLHEDIANGLGIDKYRDKYLGGTTEKLEGLYYTDADEINNVRGKLCVDNGVLDISDPGDPALNDHSPEHLFTSKLEVEYREDADCPKFKKYLREVVPDEADRKRLQEYAGYCLHNWGVPFNRSLLLLGPTQSGKSVFLGVLGELLGRDNVTHESVQRLSNNRFAPYGLVGSIANIDSDLGTSTIEDTGTFKKIAAGDNIRVEEKYESAFDHEVTQKLLFSANEVPEVESPNMAFYNRWIFVRFPKSIPRDEQNEYLQQELTQDEELSGVLNWMLEVYERLMGQSGFSNERSRDEKRSEWLSNGDSITRFIHEEVEIDPTAVTPMEDMKDAYRSYCSDEGITAESGSELTRELKSRDEVDDAHRGPRNEQYRVYTGVELSADEDESDSKNDEGSSAKSPW